MCLVLQHGGCSGQNIICNQIFTNCSNYNACRAYIFLNATIDHCIILYINGFRQEAGRNIRNKIFPLCIGKFFILCTVNGIVFTDIHIVSIGADRKIRTIGNIGECLIFTGCNAVCLAEFLCFLPCFLCPCTGYDIISNAVFHEIHGDHGELL